MFVDQVRRAIRSATGTRLLEISSSIWKAHAVGQIGEEEVQALAEEIEARKALGRVVAPSTARPGSRPRSEVSLARRRRWVAAGYLPPRIAANFTMGEQSVLGVVAAEVAHRGSCTLTIGHIAALAGVGETTVRNALRNAARLDLLAVEQRRVTAWRNAPNRVKLIAPDWVAWLRLRPRGGGCKSVNPTDTGFKTGSLLQVHQIPPYLSPSRPNDPVRRTEIIKKRASRGGGSAQRSAPASAAGGI